MRRSDPPDSTERPRILIVDDDPDLLEVLTMLLESDGWEVVSARDGSEALAVDVSRLTAAVVDLTLPRQSGRDVARGLREFKPELCIVIMSGFDRNGASVEPDPGMKWLRKPFDIPELLRLLPVRR